MTFAAADDISLPNKQRRLPFLPFPFAQVANSSGVGLCPRSAAHRRTMKPSIIFDSPLIRLGALAIGGIYRKCRRDLQGQKSSQEKFTRWFPPSRLDDPPHRVNRV